MLRVFFRYTLVKRSVSVVKFIEPENKQNAIRTVLKAYIFVYNIIGASEFLLTIHILWC